MSHQTLPGLLKAREICTGFNSEANTWDILDEIDNAIREAEEAAQSAPAVALEIDDLVEALGDLVYRDGEMHFVGLYGDSHCTALLQRATDTLSAKFAALSVSAEGKA